MIELNEYIKKYNLTNKKMIKEKIKNKNIFYSEYNNGIYYIDKNIWKIDLRRMPKKITSLNIKASIVRAINYLVHLDHQMLNIEKETFLEYLSLLEEQKFIRLVKNKDKNRIENYIIGNVISEDIINNRKKLLLLLEKFVVISIKAII